MYTHSGTHTCAHTHKERTRLLMCNNHKPDPICSHTARALGYQLSVMFAYIQHFHSSFWTFICQLATAALMYISIYQRGCQGTSLSKTISHFNLLWSSRTNSNFYYRSEQNTTSNNYITYSITQYSYCALAIDCELVSCHSEMGVLCAAAMLLALTNTLTEGSHCRTHNKSEYTQQ